MPNIADSVMAFLFQNIFYIVIIGLIAYILFLYVRFGRRTTYKVIDREEVERQKFIDMMKLNVPPKSLKLLCRGEKQVIAMNGGGGIKFVDTWKNYLTLGIIRNYLEFEQIPIKIIEKQGVITYENIPNEEPMKLIAMVIKPVLFWKIPNPMKKELAVVIENDKEKLSFEKSKIVLPSEYGFDKFIGYYYALGETTKPKLRNILDARILVNDFNLMASRYFAKSQEQCVYAPEVAAQLAQREKELQIELAKSRGIQKSV